MAFTHSIVLSHADNTLAYALLATLGICLMSYAITLARFGSVANKKCDQKTPPVVPHFLPLIGNIPWQFIWNPIDLFKSGYYALLQHPIRIQFFTREFYIIQGRKNVVAHLAQTSTSNTIFNASFLRQACGMSDKGVERLGSETEQTPNYFKRKYLSAAPLYAWSSSVIHRYLGGKSAFQLSQRFENNLRDRFLKHEALAVPEGVMLTDFQEFFSNEVTAALLDAMCGKGLLERNPSFTNAFSIFCDSLPIYMKGMPRFLAPKVYKARDDAIAAVVDWQVWASQNFDAKSTPLDEDGDGPLWGSAFFRERFSTFVYDMGFDPRDIACMELGFLFGASANVTMNTYWCAIDVFRDPKLLLDVRREFQACKAEDTDRLHFDMNKLLQQPLLQAVFTESLRLRCHNMFIRKTTETININEWTIPKDRFVIAWSTPGQMDSKLWATENENHPVDTFWPGRFLKQPDASGPIQFCPPATEGSWLPFGSGANLCPGRHFAKIHCILTLAMMVETFDCDILAKPETLKLDLNKFGMGVLNPKGKVSARIRRRG